VGRILTDTTLPLPLDMWTSREHVDGAEPSTRAMPRDSV
jgi:hypothetical protein